MQTTTDQQSPPSGQAVVYNSAMSDLDDIKALFDDINAADRKRMNEDVFREVFLPMFADDAERKYPKVTMTTWLNAITPEAEVADTAYVVKKSFVEVDIIDKKGNILFTVPSTFSSASLNPMTQEEGLPSMTHMVKTTQLYMHNSPAQAARYLENELNRRPFIRNVPDVVRSNAVAWNLIFKRYDREEIKTADADVSPDSNSDSSELEFDEM